jgi:hypothetical protein
MKDGGGFMNKPGMPGNGDMYGWLFGVVVPEVACCEGCPIAGRDVSGFGGSDDADAELFTTGIGCCFAFIASKRCLISSVVRALCSAVTGGFVAGIGMACKVWTGAGGAAVTGGVACGGLGFAAAACFASFAACRRAM